MHPLSAPVSSTLLKDPEMPVKCNLKAEQWVTCASNKIPGRQTCHKTVILYWRQNQHPIWHVLTFDAVKHPSESWLQNYSSLLETWTWAFQIAQSTDLCRQGSPPWWTSERSSDRTPGTCGQWPVAWAECDPTTQTCQMIGTVQACWTENEPLLHQVNSFW